MSLKPSPTPDELCEIVVLTNKRGLHARAAARFVREAALFKADVFVTKGDMRVAGNSIMGLMMLAAPCGSKLALCVSGEQALAALDALSDLIRRGFDEDRD